LLLLLLLLSGQPLPPDACEVHVAPCLARFAFSSLRVQHYQALLINTGWEVTRQQQQQQQQGVVAPQQQQQQQQHLNGVPSWEQCSGPEMPGSANGSSGSSSSGSSLPAVVQRLAALPVPQLCPRGFVMIWANKEHLAGEGWGVSFSTVSFLNLFLLLKAGDLQCGSGPVLMAVAKRLWFAWVALAALNHWRQQVSVDSTEWHWTANHLLQCHTHFACQVITA
jgi:hypothetical protein